MKYPDSFTELLVLPLKFALDIVVVSISVCIPVMSNSKGCC